MSKVFYVRVLRSYTTLNLCHHMHPGARAGGASAARASKAAAAPATAWQGMRTKGRGGKVGICPCIAHMLQTNARLCQLSNASRTWKSAIQGATCQPRGIIC